MLRSLLSPLRTGFDSARSPAPPQSGARTGHFSSLSGDSSELDIPEDFQRDVRIDIMRRSAEELKEGSTSLGVVAVLELLETILRVMEEDVTMSEVFREMDGILGLLSVLQVLCAAVSAAAPDKPPIGKNSAETPELEAIRLVFLVLSEAMKDRESRIQFQSSFGFNSLAETVRPLSTIPSASSRILGILLAFSLSLFSPGILSFFSLQATFPAALLSTASLHNPAAIPIMLSLLPSLPSFQERVALCGLILQLAQSSPSNLATLAQPDLDLVPSLFALLYPDSCSASPYVLDPDLRPLLLKLLKLLLGTSCSTPAARLLFERAVAADRSIDGEVLDLLADSLDKMKDGFGWPSFLTIGSDGAAQCVVDRGAGTAGFTFLAWIYLPRSQANAGTEAQTVFTLQPNPPISSRFSTRLAIRSDGSLQYETSSSNGAMPLSKSRLRFNEWIHLGFTHSKAGSAGEAACRVFLNGHLTQTQPTPYPKLPSSLQLTLGTVPSDANPNMSSRTFHLGPTHLFSYPLTPDMFILPRVLGPHYTGKFQASLVRFLTYAAATGLNLHLSSLNQNQNQPKADKDKSRTGDVVKALKDGLHPDGQAVHAMIPARSFEKAAVEAEGKGGGGWTLCGSADVTRLRPFCAAVYDVGGPSLGLRLADMSQSEAQLRSSIRVLLGMLSNSWQNSEEMEALNGFDVLAGILRRKASLISEEILNIMLVFVGVDFDQPDRSVIINTIAYRTIMLDFDLWCRTSPAVQRAHLAHFAHFLSSSHRRFNIKHRYAKFSIVRIFLHALRFTPYREELVPDVVSALKHILLYHFSAEHSIKPLMTFIATNVYEESAQIPSSPASLISVKYEDTKMRWKATLVLDMLVAVLHSPDHLAKFCATLPVARVLLLILGDNPSPAVATDILVLLGMVTQKLPTFPRKFELVNGWLVLRHVLPTCWDARVQAAAFDVLLCRTQVTAKGVSDVPPKATYCPSMLPPILAVFFGGLDAILHGEALQYSTRNGLASPSTSSDENLLEKLADALLELLNNHPRLFGSKTVVSQFAECSRAFLSVSLPADSSSSLRSLVDKVTHMTVMLSLCEHVPVAQRRELHGLLDHLQNARTTSNGHGIRTPGSLPNASKVSALDPGARNLVQQSISRSTVWRQKLSSTEIKRARKTLQDQREWRQQVDHQTAWRQATEFDRGIWYNAPKLRTWKIDETEGPFRSRKKLEPIDDMITGPSASEALSTSPLPISGSRMIEAVDPDDNASLMQNNAPPWADSDVNMAQGADQSWDDDVIDDKHRRVRRYLEPGDIIQAVNTVYKIVGIDSSPGLLIMGKLCIYLLEGLVENKEGEIIDARDAPKDLLAIPSGTIVEFHRHRPADKWFFEDVVGYSKRTCLFRDVALELYMRDSRSILLVFGTTMERQSVFDRLTSAQNRKGALEPTSAFPLPTPLLTAMGSVGAKFSFGGAGKAELDSATRKWQARELSNFAYLAIINQAAGRTPNDITQYPVFPWVLRDYVSEALDLTSQDTYRDLSCPMGALTPERRAAATERYEAELEGEKPFHYGTHFSSSMIVCHFLLRLSPFTHMFRALQGGSFDLAERLFRDVGRAWSSAAFESRGDVRELIPEFYICSEFLDNVNHLDLGTLQDGEKVGAVTLPPWAHGDPLLFIWLHRKALESDHVSRMLPQWIDLIFGCKQRDAAALNVYHPLTFEGAIDLESITDTWEREASVGAIHNFGQTPRQVFRTPHPAKYMDGKTSLPLGTSVGISEDHGLLTQSKTPTRQSNESVSALYADAMAERVIPCAKYERLVPQAPHEMVEWTPSNRTLSFRVDRKLVHVEEETSVTAAAFYDSRVLVTGSEGGTVSIWRVMRADSISLRLSGTMRGHQDRVNCVAVSRTWAMAVTGSEDTCMIVWDVNRMRYVRSISNESPVTAVAIGPAGDVLSCSRSTVSLHTVNCHKVASFRFTDPVLSLAFHEREYCSVPVFATGHVGDIKLWTWNADDTPEGEIARWRFVLLRTLLCTNVGKHVPLVTALEFVGESLYHGDDLGAVYAWTLSE